VEQITLYRSFSDPFCLSWQGRRYDRPALVHRRRSQFSLAESPRNFPATSLNGRSAAAALWRCQSERAALVPSAAMAAHAECKDLWTREYESAVHGQGPTRFRPCSVQRPWSAKHGLKPVAVDECACGACRGNEPARSDCNPRPHLQVAHDGPAAPASGSLANMSATIGVSILPEHTALMRISLEAFLSAAL
jgi:hypothetical protein